MARGGRRATLLAALCIALATAGAQPGPFGPGGGGPGGGGPGGGGPGGGGPGTTSASLPTSCMPSAQTHVYIHVKAGVDEGGRGSGTTFRTFSGCSRTMPYCSQIWQGPWYHTVKM